jgi:glycogen(starch) synthase
VLRLCSVFEPPPSALVGRGVKFDPIGGMQNHTAELTRALDRRGVVQTVLTTRPPTAPYFQRLGDHARVIRLGLPIRRFRQLYAPQAAIIAPILAARSDVVHVHLGEDLAVLPIGAAAARASSPAAGPHHPYESASHPRSQRPSLGPLKDDRGSHRAVG